MWLRLILELVLRGKIGFRFRFAIAPRQFDQEGKFRIEVFNPCDGSDDQKTPTAILFNNQGEFIDFGVNALQKYAEIL